jgi:hypothetical protein
MSLADNVVNANANDPNSSEIESKSKYKEYKKRNMILRHLCKSAKEESASAKSKSASPNKQANVEKEKSSLSKCIKMSSGSTRDVSGR